MVVIEKFKIFSLLYFLLSLRQQDLRDKTISTKSKSVYFQ